MIDEAHPSREFLHRGFEKFAQDRRSLGASESRSSWPHASGQADTRVVGILWVRVPESIDIEHFRAASPTIRG